LFEPQFRGLVQTIINWSNITVHANGNYD